MYLCEIGKNNNVNVLNHRKVRSIVRSRVLWYVENT